VLKSTRASQPKKPPSLQSKLRRKSNLGMIQKKKARKKKKMRKKKVKVRRILKISKNLQQVQVHQQNKYQLRPKSLRMIPCIH
jgi:hypothetical protein